MQSAGPPGEASHHRTPCRSALRLALCSRTAALLESLARAWRSRGQTLGSGGRCPGTTSHGLPTPEPTWETKRWPGPREVCAAFLGGSARLSLALAHGPQLARCRYLCPTSSSGPRVIPGPEVYGSHTWLVPGLPDCPPPPPLPPPPWAWRPPWWAGWVQPQGRASGRGLQGWDWPRARCRGPPSVRHGPQHRPRAAAHSAALSTRGTFLALECPCSRGHPSWGGVLSDSLLVAADTVRRSLSSAFSSVDPLPGPR